ncbi:MAG: helix-turn-helix domain-containing protein [Spirochaetales bacterium]|nr:helix-turn-helix domain-containing protein [Spirochaetales bacterium]
MTENYLTVDDASKLLRVKKQTLYKWICERKIPSYSLGGRTLFNENELHEWVKQHYRRAL